MSRPPRLAERILALVLPDADQEDFLGDLHERWLRQVSDSGRVRADLWYWRQTAGSALRLVLRGGGLGVAEAAGHRTAGGSGYVSVGSSLLSELLKGTRIVVREPRFAATAMLVLALGIGATTTMFSVAHGVLRDIPVEGADELVFLDRVDPISGRRGLGFGPRDVDVLRSEQRVFEDMAGWMEATFQLSSGGGRPERLSGAMVDPVAFSLLRVQPLLGRTLVPQDAAPGAPSVVLVSEGLWRDRLAASSSALGAVLRVNSTQRTVVGVMPAGFGFPTDQDVWIPLASDAGGTSGISIFARLLESVSIEQARAEMEVIAPRLREAGAVGSLDSSIAVEPLVEAFVDPSGRIVMWTMLLAVSFVLIIASGNVANLLISRGVTRQREIAVRMALGGGRPRVIALGLGEAMALASGGGLLGLGLSWSAAAWLDRTLGAEIGLWWITIALDGKVLAFTAVCVLGATVLAGITPALQASGVRLQDAMRGGSAGSSFRQGRANRVTASVQLGLSCALLVLSGLMVRGVIELESREVGFPTDGVLTSRVDLGDFDYPSPEDRSVFVAELEDRLANIPGLAGASLSSHLPGLDAGASYFSLEPPTGDDTTARPTVETRWVSTTFFGFYTLDLQEGRLFTSDEAELAEPTVVVNETLARRLDPGSTIVGRRLYLGTDPNTLSPARVIGVVRDEGVSVRQGAPFAGVFLPLRGDPQRTIRISIRAPDDVRLLTPEVRSAVAEVDAALPLHSVALLDDVLDAAFVAQRTFGITFAVFGIAALLLSTVGIYGVVAFGVSCREREIGVRRALGATGSHILRRTVGAGFAPLGVGLLAGLGLAFVLAPSLGDALFGADPRDPLVFSVVPLTLSVVVGIALWIPAMRAVRLDPMSTLRSE